MSEKKATKKLRITLIKSPIGAQERHKLTVKALGLKRMHMTVEHSDNPAVRGMIAQVAHLVKVEEV
ncbi:MAG: 50S ribosomal protein L30 [Chloroflexota bacterium]|jgi:large subunit ribosomal protein L30|uniref:Large ribosomal subunit protein uL30 n=1 Tax=Candidatus Thermofonsia Clade 1 bacterium TaxID=2364210 RepID=A0A2M8PYK1_9CHLR|nr:MAG: 50S ribosomal protein L30 [Candidatus Thermofonsia Clade 1 bacterium]RMF51615.1 MAG: 50S ribosomal protein L30 [Chloroflexota bacterium]